MSAFRPLTRRHGIACIAALVPLLIVFVLGYSRARRGARLTTRIGYGAMTVGLLGPGPLGGVVAHYGERTLSLILCPILLLAAYFLFARTRWGDAPWGWVSLGCVAWLLAGAFSVAVAGMGV